MHIFPHFCNYLESNKSFGIFLASRGSDGAQMCEIAPLDSVEIGQYRNRVVGWVTRPSVPHTSHLFDGQVDKVELYCF